MCEAAQLLCRLIAYTKLCVCAAFAPKIALATRLTPLGGDTSALLPSLPPRLVCLAILAAHVCLLSAWLLPLLRVCVCVRVCGWAIKVDQLGQHLTPKKREIERERGRKDDNSKPKLKRNWTRTAETNENN